MPRPKRQRTATNAAAQSTLPFNRSKPGVNKVTKPTSSPPSKTHAKESTTASADQLKKTQADPTPAEPEPITFADSENAHAADEDEVEDEDVLRARRIPKKQINAYWAKKDDERKAPRAHQGQIPQEGKILREFDLSVQYGPCIGISRWNRWMRARDMGLEPPIEVLAVLVKVMEVEEGPKGARGRNKGSAEYEVDKGTGQRSVVEDLILGVLRS